MRLNHSRIFPLPPPQPWSMEKLSTMKPVPDAKTVLVYAAKDHSGQVLSPPVPDPTSLQVQ